MLLIRLYWGYNLVVNGYTKLSDTKATQTFFHSIGLPPFLGYVVGLLEIVTGVHYIIGLTTQFATLVVVIITLNAYLFAHRDGLFALFTQPSKFIAQPPFLFLLTALFVCSRRCTCGDQYTFTNIHTL